ncbi:hypothetical protein PF010_g29971 [Phytophthora fragariae]|uniref:Peptidase A2 domain-containing protein n=1 Tax=Phytophthora fragariae TaxID=53985 RepID=A0A6G0JLK8_9STRA|nr:hypothetical protein PF010_g29971 [Phytophthora fragariae]
MEQLVVEGSNRIAEDAVGEAEGMVVVEAAVEMLQLLTLLRQALIVHPQRNQQHARELRERREAARGMPARKFGVMEAGKPAIAEDRGSVVATVDEVAVKALRLDTGADASLVARGVLDALEAMGKTLSVRPVAGITLSPVGKGAIAVTRSVIFREVVPTTTAGPLMLRNLSCYVEEHNNSMEMIVGRPIMKLLGYSTDKLLPCRVGTR